MDKDWFKNVIELHHEVTGDPQLRVLALDPGETTGVALFSGPNLLRVQQVSYPTLHGCFSQLRQITLDESPNVVVMENYKIYNWKAKDHSWSELFTPRLIGALECLCEDIPVKLVKQMAQIGKGFCTDDKLKLWGLYEKGQRHSRDAMRHACYYYLFEVAKVQQKQPST